MAPSKMRDVDKRVGLVLAFGFVVLLVVVSLAASGTVAKPGSGGVGQYMETLRCEPGPPVCGAMEAAVARALEGESHPPFRVSHVYAGTEDDPASAAGQAVLPAIAFADTEYRSALHLTEFRCWIDATGTYSCQAP